MMSVDINKMIEIKNIARSEIEHKDEIIILANEAKQFLISHDWCKKINKGFFDRGWGYSLSIFYFLIEPISSDIPDSVWLIVGDLPPAYIDVADNPNGACALEGYVIEMQQWVDNVLEGKSLDQVIPVNVPPDKEYAEMLSSRIDFIRNNILKYCVEELEGHS